MSGGLLIQASIGAGAVDRFFMPAIQGWAAGLRNPCIRIKASITFIRKRESRLRKALWLPDASLSLSKEVVGIHALLTRSLSGDGIPHSSLLRVSRVKLTSALLRSRPLRHSVGHALRTLNRNELVAPSV